MSLVISGSLFNKTLFCKKFYKSIMLWRLFALFKIFVVFVRVSVEVAQDDTGKVVTRGLFDMIDNMFDEMHASISIVITLMSIVVDDFEFLAR